MVTERGRGTGLCWGVLTVLKENLFTMREVRRWDKLPREASDALCLTVLGTHLHDALSHSAEL